jgi:hypothetical protein
MRVGDAGLKIADTAPSGKFMWNSYCCAPGSIMTVFVPYVV